MKRYLLLIFLPILFGGCQPMRLSQAVPEPIPSFKAPQDHIKVALVLGGGGSKGLAHVGVLRELEQAGTHDRRNLGE